jgi:carbon monoxide dehydrogenase subunit G
LTGVAVITVEGSTNINRSADEVFAFVSDAENDSKWMFDVVEAHSEGGPGEIGARVTNVVKFMGTREVSFEVTESEPGRRLTRETRSGAPMGIKPRISLMLEPSEGGTRLIRRVEVEPQGLAKLMTPMLGGSIRKYNARFLEDLRKALET